MKLSSIPNIKFLDSNNFFLIAGPCAIESEEMAFRIAEKTIEISERLEIPYIFKGSFKKANRSRLDSFTGIELCNISKLVAKRRPSPQAPKVFRMLRLYRFTAYRSEKSCRHHGSGGWG